MNVFVKYHYHGQKIEVTGYVQVC